jgi:hypothetical protein
VSQMNGSPVLQNDRRAALTGSGTAGGA